jgi:hypothetical protein
VWMCGSVIRKVRCCVGHVLRGLVVNDDNVRHEPCEPSLGGESFRAKALSQPSSRCRCWRRLRMLFPFLEASSWNFSSNDGLVSPGENPNFGQPERAMTVSASHPSCGHFLGESTLVVVCGLFGVGVSGRQGSNPGWWMCIEAAASRYMVGRCFMRRDASLG